MRGRAVGGGGDKPGGSRMTRSRANYPAEGGEEGEGQGEGGGAQIEAPQPLGEAGARRGTAMSNGEREDYLHLKKRKLRNGGGAGEREQRNNLGGVRNTQEPLTDIEKHLNIRKQIEQRRKNLFPVQPKPPQVWRLFN